MCVASGMFVAAAQAVGGPQWTIEEGGVKKPLTTGTRAIASITNLTKFKLVASGTGSITIVCNKVKLGSNGGTLAGGNPGLDRAEVVFEECTVEGHPNCKAEEGSTGKIITKVMTMLAFEKPKAASMALDAFFPEGANFASFKLVGTAANCPAGDANITVTVVPIATATSVALAELGTHQCGVLAKIGKSSGSIFELTKNTELFPKGGMAFPEPALTEGEYWNGTKFEPLTCGLEVKLGSNKLTATEVGEAEIDLAAGITTFGWE
jgi:hypothetical protein